MSAGQLHSGAANPFENHRAGRPRGRRRLRSADDKRRRGDEPVLIGDRHLERLGGRLPLSVADLHAVGPVGRQAHLREIGVDVGREIVGRVANLVQELFADALDAHHSATIFRLGDHDAAVAGDLRDRIADVGQRNARRPGGEHPPVHWAPHSIRWPATVAAARRLQSRQSQPNS